MTLEEIQVRLVDCANKRFCKRCSHARDGRPTMTCEEYMVREMADECRKLVEQMGDDGK